MLRVHSVSQLPSSCQRAIKAQSTSKKRRGRDAKSPYSLECSPIEALLCPAISDRWRSARREYKPLANRNFLIDIAFPEHLLAIEADGWQYHGKFLRDHKRDRERQNLLVLGGWRFLRYTAKDIRTNMDLIMQQVDLALQNVPSRRPALVPLSERALRRGAT
jgi:very-short-patch-repair endonuclease